MTKDVTSPLGGDQIAAVVREWLQAFSAVAQSEGLTGLTEVVAADSWWRDLLAFSGDLRTCHGPAAMREVLAAGVASAGLSHVELDKDSPAQLIRVDADTQWIEALWRFETASARCRGVVRLVPGGDGRWRAWTVLTAVDELKGGEPGTGTRRPTGHEFERPDGPTWLDDRNHVREFDDADPVVLVVGAGQGGLAIAAQLGALGISTLVIDKNPRIGDNWRNRYRSLILHDPVWADHMPYLPFPECWPIYTPKDKLADWLESYASAMELNVWTGTTLLDSAYDDEAGVWSVSIRKSDGSERTLAPRHVILATGAVGAPVVPDLPGMDEFGGRIAHSSAHGSGEGSAGQRVVVIGTGNSGHDIAQDFCENGADVTMVQRSATYVMSQEHGIPTIFGGLYYEGGPATDVADLLNASYPYPVIIDFGRAQTPQIAELDRDLLEGLERVGFALDMGIEDGGLMGKALHRAGGYYIDVGCSRLIVEGRIKVKSGVGVERITQDGLTLADGTVLPADVIILATGFSNMRETARTLFGDSVADRCGLVWDLDDEGEIKTLWKRSGHPGFWFMGGALLAARINSKYLALQIQSIEMGLSPKDPIA